ncbi:MAG: DUF3999 family protein [Rhizobacter sp.]|nr:DUF3999 family protein [Rhizobacter sp.]
MWRKRSLAGLLAICGASAIAGEAALVLQGPAVYHGLRVPLAVMAQTRFADLGDIQVLNARGEPVPHAWVDEFSEAGGPTAQEHRQAVPFFKAPAAASAVDASQQGGWIIDTRAVKGALLTLQLSVAPGTQGIYGFALEHSNDLQRWSTLQRAAQLLSLQHQGLRLEHTSFELDGLRARYLRLRPLPGSTPPPLSAARVVSVSHHHAAPPLQWSEPIAPSECNAQHCDYTLPRHLPLERLQWQLAAANTLAPLELLVQYDSSVAGASQPARRYRHRDHLKDTLKGVRSKTSPQPAAEAAAVWSPLQRTTAYWLRLPQGEVRSPELALDAGLVTRLRVRPVGGMVQLGATPPTIRVGARPAALVFLGREPAPFRLAWGGELSTSALTLAQLMPTRQPGDTLPTDTATVVLAAATTPAAAASTAAPKAAAAASAPSPTPSRKFWLWGVLLAALALMGFMAWSLLRPSTKS